MKKSTLLSSAALGAGILSVYYPASATGTVCVSNSEASPQPTFSQAGGLTYCLINVANYANSCTGTNSATQPQTYPIVSSTGTTLCLQAFTDAMNDAGTYFYDVATGVQPASSGFFLKIPQGSWNFSSLSSTHAVFSLPNYNPGANLPSYPPPSNEMLVVNGQGDGSNGTTLITSHLQRTIHGESGTITTPGLAISNVRFASIVFDRDYAAIGQGTLIETESFPEITSTGTVQTPALVVAMQSPASSVNFQNEPGFYNLDTGFGAGGQLNLGVFSGQYVRAYDNVSVGGTFTPKLDSRLYAGAASDSFLPFHNICNNTNPNSCLATGTLINTGSITLTASTLTLLMGPVAGQALGPNDQAAYDYFTDNLSNGLMVCVREAGANADFADINDSNAGGGSNIQFDHIVLTEAARSVLDSIHGISITNSSVIREPAVSIGSGQYQSPCLSTDSGGFQIQSSLAGSSYAHTITSLAIQGTADVPLEFFDDASGSVNGTSVVSNSSIADSFGPVAVTNVNGSYTSVVQILPYAGPGISNNAPYNQTKSATCPTGAGANCIIDEWNNCPNTSNTSGTLVYCPVLMKPD